GAADNGPYITYFHGALFVLFGGVRPINHLLALLAGGTRELQGRVHYPPVEDPEEEELKLKVERMEIIVSMLTEKFREMETAKIEDGVKKQHNMLEVQDTFEKTAARLEDGARRREKKSEIALESIDRRVEGLEKQYEALLSISVREAEANKPPNGTLRALVVALLDWIDAFWNSWRPRSSRSRRAPAFATNPRYESRRYPAGGNGAIIGGRGLAPLHRRAYDGSGQNLDTVLEEEGHEFESKGDLAVPRDVPGVDLPHSIPESLEVNNSIRAESYVQREWEHVAICKAPDRWEPEYEKTSNAAERKGQRTGVVDPEKPITRPVAGAKPSCTCWSLVGKCL
ncbi:10475_t:CDS:2, partial [Acaulospora colombiana]